MNGNFPFEMIKVSLSKPNFRVTEVEEKEMVVSSSSTWISKEIGLKKLQICLIRTLSADWTPTFSIPKSLFSGLFLGDATIRFAIGSPKKWAQVATT